GKEYPELHIIFKSNTDGEAQPYAIRGSYNIASLLNNRFVKGVKVVYRGATGTQSQTVEFDRAGLTPSN
ncbi:MAG: hypothetical protein K2F79_02455, partial [Muribaculaceae bacterium]|nr:hypothetical protein [Muribaculaceae bacterium]